MRKTWFIMLLSAVVPFMAVGCSQTTSTAPKEVKVNESNGEAAKPPTQENAAQPEEIKPTGPSFTYPDAVRGIYVTAHSAGGERMPRLIKLVDETDLNAMVIDIKDDDGWITYSLEGELAAYSKPYIRDPKVLLQTLSEHNIYPIARIVVFKDSVLAANQPDTSFKQGAQVWKNRRGEAFVNPFLKSVWDHNIKIAKLAAELGFQEIQFDYVRFPEGFENRDKTLTYSMGEYTKEKLEPRLLAKWEQEKIEWEKQKLAWEQKHKEALGVQHDSTSPADTQDSDLTNQATLTASATSEHPPIEIEPMPPEPPQPVYDAVKARVTAVTDFVQYAKEQLKPYGVKVSVDIFGYTATLPEAPGIGQNFTEISEHVDVISSMIYPSHWGPGYFNIPKPDTEPYRLVQEYAKMEKEKLAQLVKPPISRPWIQDFTATWLGKGNYISYGKHEVEQQIKALNEAGLKEFLIWNAGNSYSPGVDYSP